MFFISSIKGTQTQYSPTDAPRGGVSAIGKISEASPISPGHITDSHRDSHKSTTQNRNPYTRLDEPSPTRQPAITASQIMTSPVITLKEHDSVESAWLLFRERHFRHLPIVSDHGDLVGILSDRDFITLGLDHVGKELTRAEQLSSSVSTIMKIDVLTARPYTEIRLIAQVMFTEGVSAIPIVDDQIQLIGILTTNDILRTFVNNVPLELWI